MNRYFSTFISGFQELIKERLEKDLPDIQIDFLFDGLAIYKTNEDVDTVKDLDYLNNSFLLLNKPYRVYDTVNPIETIINRLITDDISVPKISGKSIKIITSRENVLVTINREKLSEIERFIKSKIKLPANRVVADIEFWLLYRNEGYGLAGIRLTKPQKQNLQKGELRPELVSNLVYLSEPNESDNFLDPFAGYGTIPSYRFRLPHKQIKSFDIHKEKQNFFTNNLINNSIDKIITDPPWGMFYKINNIQNFYQKIFSEFTRILKPQGEIVLLTAQKELVEKLIQDNQELDLIKKFDILVSGNKAGVYKIIRK